MDEKTCAREWATRPDDQRFGSLAELRQAAETDRRESREARIATSDMHAVPGPDGSIALRTAGIDASFTNWSFGQFCATVGAPTRYLTSLPAMLASDCANEGLRQLGAEQRRDVNSLLLRRSAGQDMSTLRAMTSTSYARAWDDVLISACERLTSQNPQWSVPPSWPGKQKPGGLYRSDRDLFMFLTNGGSIVTDPTLRGRFSRTPGADDGGDQMFRGFIARNSEVGSATLSISTFLFRVVCGNHMIGGLSDVREYKRRHVGSGRALTYMAQDALQHVGRWLLTPASVDEQLITRLAGIELGANKPDVVCVLRGKHGLTESQAVSSYELAEEHEACSPRSVWGIAQGLTRLSQGLPTAPTYNDERWSLDRRAGEMLAKYGR